MARTDEARAERRAAERLGVSRHTSPIKAWGMVASSRMRGGCFTFTVGELAEALRAVGHVRRGACRVCACGCGQSIAHLAGQARWLSDAHRMRAQRRAQPVRRTTRRSDPYLVLPAGEYEALVQRMVEGCRCNGTHILDPAHGSCCKCGHQVR